MSVNVGPAGYISGMRPRVPSVLLQLLCGFLVGTLSVAGCEAEVSSRETPTPAGLTAIAGNGAVFLSWDEVVDFEGRSVRYTLYAGLSADLDRNSAREPGATTPMVDSQVVNGVRTYYAVTATIDGQESAFSRVVSALPDVGATAPGAVQNLQAEGRQDGILLRFQPHPFALGYTLYRGRESGVNLENGTALVGISNDHLDTNTADNQTYFYVVTATTSEGETPISREASAARGTTATPPSAPTGLSATPGDGQVTLRFDAVPGASSYTAYFSTTPGVSPTTGAAISNLTNPYTHTGLANGVPVYYVVTAANTAGVSPPSAEVQATPQPSVNPAAVIDDLAAIPGDGQVTLTFSPGAAATGYVAFVSETPGVTTSSFSLGSVTSPATHTGLQNDATYYYRVAAETADGLSPLSNEVSATPTATPFAPHDLSSTLPAGTGVIVQFENRRDGTGLVQVQVVNGAPETGSGIEGLSVDVTGEASGSLPSAGGGSYTAATPAWLSAGTYSFSVSGARTGVVNVTLGAMPECTVTTPSAGAVVPRGIDLPVQWVSAHTEKVLLSFEDSGGTVTYPALGPPDPLGGIVPGEDLSFAGPVALWVRGAAQAARGDARLIALGACGVDITAQ